jgi:hypothetical protein
MTSEERAARKKAYQAEYNKRYYALNSERLRADVSNRGPEYKAWVHIKGRCYNPATKSYARYGGRGITVCGRWRESFEAFLEDMGQRPSSDHSIDRIDNDGNYSPENCRWATREEQGANKRNNRYIVARGKRQTVSQWARELGVPVQVLDKRLTRGWDHERVVGEVWRDGVKRPKRYIEAFGKRQTLAQWGRELGVRPSMLEQRLRVLKWPVEKALSHNINRSSDVA